MSESTLDSRMTRIVRASSSVPPSRWAEYIYFALILYGIIAVEWGISVPLVGAGGMGLLAIYCLWRPGKNATSIYAPLCLPVGCAISFLLVQIVFYGVSIMDDHLRVFVTWIFALIVIQYLVLREGFLHRFAIAASIIGLVLLQYLELSYSFRADDVTRAGLEGSVSFRNPNDLAAWFGFCCVYFMVLGIETRRQIVRLASYLAAGGCLLIVGLTVSRATLMGIAFAGIIALRHLLKRGFLPALLFTALACVIFFSGLFNQSIGFYMERGTEESGRFLVWPLAIGRFLDSPFVGVGVGESSTYVPEMNEEITAHNGFIYIGLASGIIPLGFFVAYWIKAGKGAYHLTKRGLQNAPFQLPLIVYTLIIVCFGTTNFMFPWAIVTLCNAMPRRMNRIIARRILKHGTAEQSADGMKQVYSRPLAKS